MKLYSAKIRLAGSANNEVRKDKLTVPEIMVLRQIHGFDAVLELKPDGEVERRTHAMERDRLTTIYGVKVIGQMFGQAHMSLPTVLPDLDLEAAEEYTPENDAVVAAEKAEADALVS